MVPSSPQKCPRPFTHAREPQIMKNIAKHMCIEFGQLFINGLSAHLLLYIYLSSLDLKIELEKTIKVI